MLRDTSRIAVTGSLVRYGTSLESSCDASFDETRISSVCKNVMSRGCLQGAVDTKNRHYVRRISLVRQCSEALRLVEKLNEKAAADDSAAGKRKLGFTQLDSVLHSQSGEQNALLPIESPAAHTKEDMKDKNQMRSSNLFFRFFYAAAIIEESYTV